ncbi:Glucose-6-phosphate 1-dehydrogenase [Gigaspora margarita]|uniref:Glucose-6-phosphate 1-dehydrogenase n=1 Tax=Gigaspora margarita TaxID=4874 RepID=A0A8H4AKE8_GIGMA|nr:Glucose-6-phosphate 1-dehydrogenase [Gigaspora margarita]
MVEELARYPVQDVIDKFKYEKKVFEHYMKTAELGNNISCTFGLYRNGFLSEGSGIIGYARSNLSLQEFHNRLLEYAIFPTNPIKEQPMEFLKICTNISGQYDKDDDYKRLNKTVEEVEKWK